jgi:hypothetical protein
MKKLFLAIFCFLTMSNTLFSQMTKDSLVKIMADEVCGALSNNEKESKSESLEEALGTPFMMVFGKYAKEINLVYGFTAMNETNGAKVGKDVGAKLGTDCPAFMNLLLKNVDETKELLSRDKKTKETKISGVLLKINVGEFSYLEVKTYAGKIEKMYWMEYFENANDLMNTPTKFINKNIVVNYAEKEIYKSSIKEYVKIKVITDLTID